MTSRRSRIAGFRRSVITVAAAFAPLAGCSLDHGGGTKHSIDPACDDADASGCMPGCPSAAPQADSACPSEGQACDFEPCGNTFSKHAECKDGAWQVTETSCNPPPMPQCPQTEPNEGDSCAGANGFFCSYNPQCPGLGATCMDGKWQITVGSCNPPPPSDCPAQQPSDGTPCSLPQTEPCVYAYCAGQPQTTATCQDSVWHVSQSTCNPPATVCPDGLPIQASACPGPGQVCTYGQCLTGGEAIATCTAQGWLITDQPCDPTPIEPCPDDVPDAETMCNRPPDQACTYGPCNETVVTCGAGVWTIEVTDPVCPLPPTTECPKSRPQANAACNYTGADCSYDEAGHHYSAQCVNKKWSINDFGFPD